MCLLRLTLAEPQSFASASRIISCMRSRSFSNQKIPTPQQHLPVADLAVDPNGVMIASGQPAPGEMRRPVEVIPVTFAKNQEHETALVPLVC